MAEKNAMNVRIVDGDDCCPQAMCVKVCNLVQEVRKTGASKKLIPSEKAVSDALKGRQELLVAGAAEGILGPSAATGLAQVLTAPSTGVSIVDAIKGRTLVWNQLVDDDTETVTVPSGHKYFALIGGVASVATSDGTALSVTGGTDNVVDLTQMFSAGNEPATVAEFTAICPNFPYAYNAGTLLPFKGTGIKVTGLNQFDDSTLVLGKYRDANGIESDTSGRRRSDVYYPIFGGSSYYLKFEGESTSDYAIVVCWYDLQKTFISGVTLSGGQIKTSPAAARYMRISSAASSGNICINLSDPAINGIYRPYTETLVNIDAIGKTAKDADGNAIVPFPTGMYGKVVYDEANRTGGVKRRAQIDIGSLTWEKGTSVNPNNNLHAFYAVLGPHKVIDVSQVPDDVLQSYEFVTNNDRGNYTHCAFYNSNNPTTLYIFDSSKDNLTADEFKAAVDGIYLDYELLTPVPFTWDEPFTLAFTAEEGGTIWLQPEGVDEEGVPVSAPLNADIAYTVPAGQVINATTLDNLLDALKTASVISAYTLTPDGNGNYTFTITA